MSISQPVSAQPAAAQPEAARSATASSPALADIFAAIKADPANQAFTDQGIDPLYSAYQDARVCFIGQAPGLKAQQRQRFWDDASGDRLRQWTGIDWDTFYSSHLISIVPMDFYYPGKGKSGDLPPRQAFAPQWHPQLFAAMPKLELFILIGSYAQRYYLHLAPTAKTTDVIRDFQSYLPTYFPLVHPSPRNNIWLRKNPWFEAEVVPALKTSVAQVLEG